MMGDVHSRIRQLEKQLVELESYSPEYVQTMVRMVYNSSLSLYSLAGLWWAAKQRESPSSTPIPHPCSYNNGRTPSSFQSQNIAQTSS